MTNQELPLLVPAQSCTTCSDLDEDCDGVADKVHCWMYDPGRGMCPYLRAAASLGEQHDK